MIEKVDDEISCPHCKLIIKLKVWLEANGIVITYDKDWT
jgi:hypothetical protein